MREGESSGIGRLKGTTKTGEEAIRGRQNCKRAAGSNADKKSRASGQGTGAPRMLGADPDARLKIRGK